MREEELTDKAIDYIFSHLEDTLRVNADHRLSDWEKSFIESVSDQWTERRSLSERQKETLGKIWDKQP